MAVDSSACNARRLPSIEPSLNHDEEEDDDDDDDEEEEEGEE